ncbi:MAG: YlxR family protein [Anaerolineales bacterium]|nr:YlxR family protein [Anaerolineales bacterium]
MAAKKGRRRKHIPQRTCVGCRQVQAKRGLIRVVRSPDGVKIDPHGKLAGRGAYLHDLRSCWQKGLEGKLAHALKTEISAEDMAVLKDFMHSLPLEAPEESES